MEIHWDEITSDNITSLVKVFQLYDEAFPVEVREPHEIFLKGLKYAGSSYPNNFRILVGFEGDHLVSFAIGHYLAEVNSGFIVYIATNPQFRGKGLGSETLRKLEKLLTGDANQAGYNSLNAIVLETERQELVITEEEKEDCIKRNRFYEKNNYKLLEEIDYQQPPLHNSGESVPLNLFIKNLRKNKISKEEITKIIRAMYHEKYYLVNGIDKAILHNCLAKMGIE